MKKISLEPFKKNYAHDYVSSILREQIITGVYKPGDQLPSEIELSRDLGISRPAVREGLRELEGAGLVVTTQGSKGGRVVQSINSDMIASGLDLIIKSQKANFKQLMGARILVESGTAELAALNRTAEHLEAMLAIAELSRTSKEDFVTKNYEFHKLIALASQNMVLYYLLQALRKLIFRSYSLISLEEIEIETAIKSHWTIYKAIESQDPEKAKKAITYDLEAYTKNYENFIEKQAGKTMHQKKQ